MKVLIAAPISEYKSYIDDKWFSWLRRLTYPNIEFFFVDNSENPNYHKKWIVKGFNVQYYRPWDENLNQIMCDCNNIIRDYFLKSDCDYLLSLEEDQFPPQDIIERLIEHERDVVGAAYHIGHGFSSKYLNCYLYGFNNDYNTIIMNNSEGFLFTDGMVKKGYNFGLGCVLISRKVMKNVKFEIQKDGLDCHADTYFHRSLIESGYEPFIDTSVICTHVNGNWKKIKK